MNYETLSINNHSKQSLPFCWPHLWWIFHPIFTPWFFSCVYIQRWFGVLQLITFTISIHSSGCTSSFITVVNKLNIPDQISRLFHVICQPSRKNFEDFSRDGSCHMWKNHGLLRSEKICSMSAFSTCQFCWWPFLGWWRIWPLQRLPFLP